MNETATQEMLSESTSGESGAGSWFQNAWRRIFSFPVFVGAVLAAGAVAATISDKAPIIAGKLFTEGDTWWHIVVGQRILSTHTWPTVDIYSFTAHGSPWIAYEWLGEVVMAIASRVAGLQGLAVLLVLLSVTFILLLYYYAWLRTGNVMASAVATALLTPVAAACLTMRPQVLGYIFLAVTLISLELFKQGKSKAIWVLPLVFFLWVNSHGSFVVGLFALGLYWASGFVSFHCGSLVAKSLTLKQRRDLLSVSLLCVAAALVTPYGAGLAVYPFKYLVGQPYIARVFTEWQPLQFSEPFAKLFLVFLVGTLVWQVMSPVVYELETLVLLIAAVAESCFHARFLIVFALVYAPVLATLFARWLPRYQQHDDHPAANATLIALMAVTVVALFPSEGTLRRELRRTFPVDAVAYLRQHPVPVGMFNEDTWGGFLTWSLGPTHQVFIDGRAEAYEHSGALADYIRIAGSRPEAFELLHRYGVTACLLHRDAPLGALLAASTGWKQVFADDHSVIFVRADIRSELHSPLNGSPKERLAAGTCLGGPETAAAHPPLQ